VVRRSVRLPIRHSRAAVVAAWMLVAGGVGTVICYGHWGGGGGGGGSGSISRSCLRSRHGRTPRATGTG